MCFPDNIGFGVDILSEKIVLIDGHSILNRAFYGLPDLTNAEGLHTNAVLGFLNIVLKILDEEKPEYFTVAFDVHAPTFRHEMFKEYKGTRKPMPEELRQQVPLIKEVLQTMGVRIVECPGLEADDILGTIAKKAESKGMEVSLVSGDRDLLQIATDHICIRIPKTKGGKTEIENYYAKDVLAAYQVTPLQFIELKALMGDTADNIPGVPKVGEKTATDLMLTYGSIAGIYEHVEEITKKAIKESLINNRDLADLSLKLATINVHGEFPYEFENARLGNLFTKEAYAMFSRLGFNSLLKKFEDDNKAETLIENSVHVILSCDELESVCKRASEKGNTAVSIFSCKADGLSTDGNGQVSFLFTEPEDFFLVALSFGAEDTYVYKADAAIADKKQVCEMLKALIPSGITVFDAKKIYGDLGVEDTATTKNIFDSLIGAYLCNPLKNDYTVEDIANEYLHMPMDNYSLQFGKSDVSAAYRNKKEDFEKYAAKIAYVLYATRKDIAAKLKSLQMVSLFEDIEMPLSYVLYTMEKEGILVQREALKEYGDNLAVRIKELEDSIHGVAGDDFNINSPKQLGEILFEKMQIPGGKKTKTGYSTAADVLEKLAPDYPFVADILEYRGLAKLKSTYADGLQNFIEEDGRIHTHFNQTITATGRISSTEPNLQNIPMRTKLGRLIRKVFVPKDGCVFVDADYSQIELRLLAHMSSDESLIEAYRSNADIHRMTASQVFNIPFEEVTDLERRNAKAVNFGIVYGISSFGLSQDLSISVKEAKKYIEQYYATYPGIKIFLDKLVADAKTTGYATTLYGRKRPVPELKSSNFMQKGFGERVAMNAPIQGTAADIMKIAMIHVYDRLAKEGMKSKMILQIHDELVIETYKGEEEQVTKILTEEMEHAADLAVSLVADAHSGADWYEAK